MKVVGVIVEYNPFHYGHRHHIQETIAKLNPDIVVAVMSGHFSQRGEPCIANKWERTKTALANGVDLVIEIPFIYSVQAADYFARYAVYLLNQLKCDHICFGSESNNIKKIENDLKRQAKVEKKPKISYINNQLDSTIKANDILGISYLKAISEINKNIKAHTIQRTNDFHDLSTNTEHASATAIRNAVNLEKDYQSLTPMRNLKKVSLNDYFNLIRLQFITNRNNISETVMCQEGIENLIGKHIFNVNNIDELLIKCSNKKYTKVRIQRTLCHILLNSKKETLNQYPMPPYLRILGANQTGIKHLKRIKNIIDIPIVTTISNYHHEVLDLEINASKVWSFIDEKILDEYKFAPIIIKE